MLFSAALGPALSASYAARAVLQALDASSSSGAFDAIAAAAARSPALPAAANRPAARNPSSPAASGDTATTILYSVVALDGDSAAANPTPTPRPPALHRRVAIRPRDCVLPRHSHL